MSTKVLLDSEVVEKVLKEVKPSIKREDISKIKWRLIEEATKKHASELTPSQRARLWKGSKPLKR